MARTEKEKKSSGVLKKSKNQKETRAWKNKWISKVKRGFFYLIFQTGPTQKNWASSIQLCLAQWANRANQVWPKLARFFQANKNRVQPGHNFGLVGLAQWARLKLPALVTEKVNPGQNFRDSHIASILGPNILGLYK